MCFDSVWLRLCEKRPELLSPTATVTMTSQQMKKLLQQVYESGRKDAAKCAGSEADAPTSLFKMIFG